MDETLRRDLALERLACLAAVMADAQAPAGQQRGRKDAEVRRFDGAGAHRQDAHAARDVGGRVLPGFEQLVQPLSQRADLFGQHAGLEIGDQAVHGEQCTQLVGAEPEPGQLPERAVGHLVIEAVGFLVAVEGDRRVEAVAQVFEVALEGGARDLERVQELLGADVAPRLQQLLDAVEAFQAFHGEAF